MHNVLVTGGAGYIGSHACKALAAAGYCPVTLDDLCLGHREFVKWGPLVEADVRDTDAVADTIRSYNVIGVMAFAAFAYVGESVSDPAKYYGNNVTGMLSLLAAMQRTGLKKIVFSSTCAVYGSPKTIPISEQTTTSPVNPYGRSKRMCEEILLDYASAYGIVPVILRYFNASGAAEPMAGLGEKRDVETHLIPRAMLSLLGHITDFEVHGNDYPTHDGTAVRDYIHVSDLADAHVLALRRVLADSNGVFNLGMGRGYSVKEVLAAIAEVSGLSLSPPSGARRQGDPPALVADTSLARDVLGFDPRFDLQAIVESAWRWHSLAHPARLAAHCA